MPSVHSVVCRTVEPDEQVRLDGAGVIVDEGGTVTEELGVYDEGDGVCCGIADTARAQERRLNTVLENILENNAIYS